MAENRPVRRGNSNSDDCRKLSQDHKSGVAQCSSVIGNTSSPACGDIVIRSTDSPHVDSSVGEDVDSDSLLSSTLSSAPSSNLHSSSGDQSDEADEHLGGVADNDEQLSSAELSELHKESEMSIEELLLLYGCPMSHSSMTPVDQCRVNDITRSLLYNTPGSLPTNHNDTYSSSEDEILTNQDLTLDKDEIARDLLIRNDTMDCETSVTDLLTITSLASPIVPHHHHRSHDLPSHPLHQNVTNERHIRAESTRNTASCPPVKDSRVVSAVTVSELSSDDDNDSDDPDYLPESDDCWKKSVSVGPDHQAIIPELVASNKKSQQQSVYSVDDRLLWDPSRLPEKQVEEYCRAVNKWTQLSSSRSALTHDVLTRAEPLHSPPTLKDDEQALYLLLQCNYNVDEALRRKQMELIPPSDPLSLWSNEERINFINGLRQYGKDFYLIQVNKVRTRSVCELVQFYYQWKKTGEQLCMLTREKRKSIESTIERDDSSTLSVPFLRDMSSPSTTGNSSVHSLLYTDIKRTHPHDNSPIDQQGHTLSFPSSSYQSWSQHGGYSRLQSGDGYFLSKFVPDLSTVNVTTGCSTMPLYPQCVDTAVAGLLPTMYCVEAAGEGYDIGGGGEDVAGVSCYSDRFTDAAVCPLVDNRVDMYATGPVSCGFSPVFYHHRQPFDPYYANITSNTCSTESMMAEYYDMLQVSRFYPSCEKAAVNARYNYHGTQYHDIDYSSLCPQPPTKRFKPISCEDGESADTSAIDADTVLVSSVEGDSVVLSADVCRSVVENVSNSNGTNISASTLASAVDDTPF